MRFCGNDWLNYRVGDIFSLLSFFRSRKNLDAYCNKAIFIIVKLIFVAAKLIYSMLKKAIFRNGCKNLYFGNRLFVTAI